MTEQSREYHVLTKAGDASREVEAAIEGLGSDVKAGLHRHFYVARADQTVVLATDQDAPIVKSLRKERGWREPGREASA